MITHPWSSFVPGFRCLEVWYYDHTSLVILLYHNPHCANIVGGKVVKSKSNGQKMAVMILLLIN